MTLWDFIVAHPWRAIGLVVMCWFFGVSWIFVAATAWKSDEPRRRSATPEMVDLAAKWDAEDRVRRGRS